MHQNWLINLDQETVVLAPTRSLANTLNEQVAGHNISQGCMVWEAPNIIIWGDYIKELWQLNRTLLNQEIGAKHLISQQQSLLLWTRVIESSRREEQALTLLNVQQTVRAVHRSWVLMHDWQVTIESIEHDHVADTRQFTQWLISYKKLLRERGLIDQPLLLEALCNSEVKLNFPYQKLIFYAFDLINGAQKKINRLAIDQSCEIEHRSPPERESESRFIEYTNSTSELMACFIAARRLIEQDSNCSINIVIHDLQDRQAQVQELARTVFYPSDSPLAIQQNSTVYRFSLGQRLNEWAAIETALSVIGLLKNYIKSVDLSFLLRNQFLAFSAKYRVECRLFDRWFKRQRSDNIVLDKLPELYQQCLAHYSERGQQIDDNGFLNALERLVEKRQELITQLEQAKQRDGYAALSFIEWVTVFEQWLEEWGWSTRTVGNELNTVQHQLLNRWQALLEEIAGLTAVQRKAGMTKAVDLLQQMSRETMFLPKAMASPVLISSILEAVGRPADYCFVLGMNDAFPPPPKNDAFVAQRLLANAGHPDMNADSSFVQAEKVVTNLLRSMGKTQISYARQSDGDREIHHQCSPLFRAQTFEQSSAIDAQSEGVNQTPEPLLFEEYQDTQGPAWADASRVKGGSKIFENQSNCAFRAFVTHQLGFQTEDEAEFGLDHLDRGNIVHHLLNLIWARLETQDNLKAQTQEALDYLINDVIHQTVNNEKLGLSEDKQILLKHERPRLISLLRAWLAHEAKRPENFQVIEREEERFAELSGIQFKYIIDRLDMSDDGRTFIIDYKTGLVNRNDWVSEPIKSPQMPLYAVALSKAKKKAVSGIAYASVRQNEHKFVELSEAGY